MYIGPAEYSTGEPNYSNWLQAQAEQAKDAVASASSIVQSVGLVAVTFAGLVGQQADVVETIA